MLENEKADIRRVCRIDITREYSHPVEELWRAISDSRRISVWMNYSTRLEPVVGGEIYVDFSPDDGIRGVVCAFDRNALLVYTWGDALVKWALSSKGGGSRLKLSHIGVEPAKAPGLAAGWHAFLDHLGPYLDGKKVADRFEQLERQYQQEYSQHASSH